ncbi:hypothetical protein RvY_00005-2 [Ramazzottius varieornatus]|uniref:Uncharacterized protein n=1 Tax=Ramazzottius varieornatus TaxID=947166 RepID=A0A1D1ULR8_RAMVA|nr:hypothetical protein RvY_00005-2 [Ramazzottius varieornatus]
MASVKPSYPTATVIVVTTSIVFAMATASTSSSLEHAMKAAGRMVSRRVMANFSIPMDRLTKGIFGRIRSMHTECTKARMGTCMQENGVKASATVMASTSTKTAAQSIAAFGRTIDDTERERSCVVATSIWACSPTTNRWPVASLSSWADTSNMGTLHLS